MCDVTHDFFPPSVTIDHTFLHPPPLEHDALYGQPLFVINFYHTVIIVFEVTMV